MDLRDLLGVKVDVIEQYLPAESAAFDRDPPLQSHIYRHLTIVGEAAWSLSAALKQQHPQVPRRQIEGMRHVLVHDYFKVNWTRVYETARNHVPLFKPQVQAILASLPPQSP